MIRYMGGKTKLVKYIGPRLTTIMKQSEIIAYYEPFIGGGSVFQSVHTSKPKYGSDLNRYLIALYNAIIQGWNPPYIEKDEYYRIRNNKDLYPDHMVAWAGFGCSFRGKWFGSYAERQPDGTDFVINGQNNIKASKMFLMNAAGFIHRGYGEIDVTDSLIYCDPPYANTAGYEGSGEKFDHEKFWAKVDEWVEKRNIVLVSEYSAPPDRYKSVWSVWRADTFGDKPKPKVVDHMFAHESQADLITSIWDAARQGR